MTMDANGGWSYGWVVVFYYKRGVYKLSLPYKLICSISSLDLTVLLKAFPSKKPWLTFPSSLQLRRNSRNFSLRKVATGTRFGSILPKTKKNVSNEYHGCHTSTNCVLPCGKAELDSFPKKCTTNRKGLQ